MSCQCQSDQLSVNSMNESAFVFNGSAPVISKLYCNSSEQLSCSSFSMDSKILPEKAKSLEGCETSIESTTMHKNSWYCNVSCEDLIPNADLDHLSLPNDNPANCQMHLSKSYNNISDLSNKKNCIDPKTKSVMFCHSSNANKDVAHHLLSKAHQGLVQSHELVMEDCLIRSITSVTGPSSSFETSASDLPFKDENTKSCSGASVLLVNITSAYKPC